MPALRRGAPAAASLLVSAALWSAAAGGVTLTPEEVAKVCADADGAAHCGRLVEEVQLKRLPNLAVRDGTVLRVSLYPSGTTRFEDVETPTGGRSTSLWDFLSEINAVVLYTVENDQARFTLLLRSTGQRVELPAEPQVSPDRARIATADFCPSRCANQLVLWRVTRDGVRKESTWTPAERWDDGAVSWKTPETLVIEYTRAGGTGTAKLERKLGDAGWTRGDAP